MTMKPEDAIDTLFEPCEWDRIREATGRMGMSDIEFLRSATLAKLRGDAVSVTPSIPSENRNTNP